MSEQEKNNSILEKRSSRRNFIKNSGLTVGGVVLGGAVGALLVNKDEADPTQLVESANSHDFVDYSETRQFFVRQKDFDALSVATELIYPEDEHGPGAIALGVPYFIDKQMASPWGSNADDYMKGPFKAGETPLLRNEIVLQGVRKLNEVSEKNHEGALFKELTEEQQIDILTSFQEGKVEMELVNSAQFFGMLRSLTLQGCFSDPLYGGNKNMAGWKMKEFPGAQMSYTAYLDEEEFVLIEPMSLGKHSHK